MKLRVLVACEMSGTVRDAFAALGHDAWSCDLLPSEREGNHIRGDAREVVKQGWDLIIAHPPCTRLANSGVSWLAKRNLWDEMKTGAEFFRAMWDAPCKRVAVENPIMHRHAREAIGPLPMPQIIQPWQFGHPEMKATCLWLRTRKSRHAGASQMQTAAYPLYFRQASRPRKKQDVSGNR